tara:strand:- start:642 stop:2180 length:1539 start_codon:yes stop_codon:yes gene_type:complete
MNTETFQSLEKTFGRIYLPILTLTILLTSFTMITYGTIVSVAVPSVMGTFGVGQDKAQLLATGFYVAMTISQLVCGWLITAIGHYYTYIISMVIFSCASLLGATSGEFYLVVVSRIIQGIAAGILVNQTNVAIVQAYPPERRAPALIMFTCGTISAMGAGPFLGGLAIEYVNWRYIFIAPLPLLFFSFILGVFVMPRGRKSYKMPFDWFGLTLLTVCLLSFLIAISDGQRQGWQSNFIISLFLFSAFSGVLFVYIQVTNKVRLLDFSHFKNSIYLLSTIIIFSTSMGNFGAIYAVPIFARVVQGLSPIDAGFIMLPASLVTLIFLPIISFYSKHILSRNACIFGLILFSLGLIPLVSADNNTPYIWMIIFVAISRIGIGINNPFVAKVAISEIPLDKIPSAMSTMNFFRILGTALGTTIWVVFLEVRTHFHSDNLINTQTPSNHSSVELINKLVLLLSKSEIYDANLVPFASHFLGLSIYSKALTFGYQDGFYMLVFIFVFAAFMGILLGKR